MKRLLLYSGLAVTGFMIVVVLVAGWAFRRRAMQVRTFTDMQIISKKIEATDGITIEKMEAIIDSVNSGKDSWGNDIILETRDVKDGLSYILVSCGSDEVLDVKSLNFYFEVSQVDICEQYTRDIVFRDGKAVTLAGK